MADRAYNLYSHSLFFPVYDVKHQHTVIDGDFPGGPVVKNPPSNVDDSGSILAQGTKIPNDMKIWTW